MVIRQLTDPVFTTFEQDEGPNNVFAVPVALLQVARTYRSEEAIALVHKMLMEGHMDHLGVLMFSFETDWVAICAGWNWIAAKGGTVSMIEQVVKDFPVRYNAKVNTVVFVHHTHGPGRVFDVMVVGTDGSAYLQLDAGTADDSAVSGLVNLDNEDLERFGREIPEGNETVQFFLKIKEILDTQETS